MIKRTIPLITALLFFMHDTTAQKREADAIQWQRAGTLPPVSPGQSAPGIAGPIAGVHDGVLIVGGGANFPDGMPWLGGKKKYHQELFLFRRSGDSLIHFKTCMIPFSIAYSATASTPEGVLSIGGENENGLTDQAFLVQWDAARDTIGIRSLPPLPFGLANAMVAYHNRKVYLAGGETTDVVSGQFFVLDLETPEGGWKRLPPLPKPVSHAVMAVQGDGAGEGLYIIGGRKRNAGRTSDLYATVLHFSWTHQTWTEKKPLPYPLSAGTGLAVEGEKILVFGGDAGATFHRTENLIAAISREGEGRKKARLNQEKVRLQSGHPGFCRQVFRYDTKADQWTTAGCIPFEVPVTTTAIPWPGGVMIPSGEVKAGVRTPHLLFGKF